MAKSALVRRRGTKKSSSRWCAFGEMGLLQTIFAGIILIGIGLVGGLMVGIWFLPSPQKTTAQSAASVAAAVPGGDGDAAAAAGASGAASAGNAGAAAGGVRGMLRKAQERIPNMAKLLASHEHPPNHKHGEDLLKAMVHDANEDAHMTTAKQEFFQHTMKIGGVGPFPYYPNNDRNSLVDANFDFQTFSAKGGKRFEEWKHGDTPYDFKRGESDALARSRRYHVKKAMQHSWSNYRQYAFGMDEILPQSKGTSNNWGGLGITLIDALDTLWLMNMTEEFYQARDWVRSSLNHNVHQHVSVFETTIRSLGGLLSAYDWSGDETFLRQAQDLGRRLFHAFDNPSGIPWGTVDLATGATSDLGWTGGNAIVAEAGTLQLENRMLARLTGQQDFKEKSEHVYDVLIQMARPDGLYPYFVRNRGPVPEFANDKVTFGAMGDSLYEYMLKIWIQGGKVESRYRDMYDKAIQSMHEKLLQVSTPSGLVFIGDRNYGNLDPKMDHLVCFMGGLLVLGAYTDPLGLESERAQRDLQAGKVQKTSTSFPIYGNNNVYSQPCLLLFLLLCAGINLHMLSNVRPHEYWDISRIRPIRAW